MDNNFNIKSKSLISIVIAFLLMLNSFVFGEGNEHWAKSNYDYFVQKNILEEDLLDFDRNISLNDFSKLYKQIANEELFGIDEESNELMTRSDAVRLLATNLELDELFEISSHDYSDGEVLDENFKNEVNKILSLGIINGYSDNTLKLGNNITYGEAITMLKRVREVSIINSISMAKLPLPEKSKEMEDLSQATRNAVELFVYGSLLNEKLLNVEYDESISEEWIKTRDEAEKIWDMLLKSSLLMSVSVDKNINTLENDLDKSLSGAKDDNLKWAQDIQAKFDAVKGNKKLGEFSKQLGMEAREALELLKLSHEIVSGNALEEAEFYRYAELAAKTTKSAAKVGLFIGSTILTAGGTTAAAGYLTMGEAASVIVSGVDVVLDVSSTASNIYIGEDGRVTMAIQEAQDAFAPVSAVFGIADFKGANLGSQIYFLGESIIDNEYDGEILGINVTDDPSAREITYFSVPLEDGKFPSDLENSGILARMMLEGNKEFAASIYDEISFNLKTETSTNLEGVFKELLPKDVDNKIGDLDFQMDDFDEKFDELLERILDSDDMDIDQAFDDLLDEYFDELDLILDDTNFDDLDDLDGLDDDYFDDYYDDDYYDDDYYDDEESEDDEDEEESEDDEDEDESEDEPEDEGVFYSLTVNYVIESGDGITPETFTKKDYKLGDKYNIPVPTVEGYTPDRASVTGTIAKDEVITVTYTEDFKPTYSLIISYIIEDGKVDPPPFHVDDSLKIGDEFSVESPLVEGYTPDIAVVEGKMTEEGVNETVIYNNDSTYYSVTLRYVKVDESGNEVGEPFEVKEEDIKVGDSYRFVSPVLDGYYADLLVYEGKMNDTGTNISHTIKYRLYPEGPDEISGFVDNSSEPMRIPVGLNPESAMTLESVIAMLPSQAEAYIYGEEEPIKLKVTWKEDLDYPYSMLDRKVGKIPYTGRYTFNGEVSVPDKYTLNPEIKPNYTVEFYPSEYPDYDRRISSNGYLYNLWYEDIYGNKQGPYRTYYIEDGSLYESGQYVDDKQHGEWLVYDGSGNVSKTWYNMGEQDYDHYSGEE